MLDQTSQTQTTRLADHDLYRAVHRGLRLAHGRVLQAIATTNPADGAAVGRTIAAVETHMKMCRSHLAHENAEIHGLAEARIPGAADHAAEDHDHHDSSLREIDQLLGELWAAGADSRRRWLDALYRRFALFMAEDLLHMEEEEGVLMPLMQMHFTNAELQAVEGRIVAAIPFDEMVLFMRPMLAAMCGPEREETLTGMCAGMPAGPFDALMAAVVGRPWRMGDWRALDAALR